MGSNWISYIYNLCGKPLTVSDKIKHTPTLWFNYPIPGIYSKYIKAQKDMYKMFIALIAKTWELSWDYELENE